MQARPSHVQRVHGGRHCWRMSASPGVVLFHGRHVHEFMPHTHDVATLILVTDGAVQIEVDGLSFSAGPGDVVAIGAWQVHAARPLGRAGWEMRSMHFPTSLLCDASFRPTLSGPSVVFAQPRIRGAGDVFMELHRISTGNNQSRQQDACLKDLVEVLKSQVEVRNQTAIQSEYAARVWRAKHMIEANLFDNMPVGSIAEEVGLSPFTLIRQFKRHYGTSPHAWRMQTRANIAAKFLHGSVSLTDIAGSCGFCDQSHFTRVFKRVFGVTPGEYSLVH